MQKIRCYGLQQLTAEGGDRGVLLLHSPASTATYFTGVALAVNQTGLKIMVPQVMT